MKKDLLLLSGISAASLIPSMAQTPEGEAFCLKNSHKPNVIIILADDLGYGDLQCYGARNVLTPNVDRLAESGIRFTNAHAVASTSTPSRYSLLTGMYSWRRNDTDVARGDAAMIIRPEQYSLADMFKNAGYATCAIGKWHLGLGDVTGRQDWKYIEPSDGKPMIDWGPKIETGYLSTPQLFDMRKNTGERNNVASKHTDVLFELQNILRKERK